MIIKAAHICFLDGKGELKYGSPNVFKSLRHEITSNYKIFKKRRFSSSFQVIRYKYVSQLLKGTV